MASSGPLTLTSISNENFLHKKFVRDEDERPKVAYNQFSDQIPLISLSGIDDESDACNKRKELCKKIAQACEDWGIFQVIDHGVDSKLINDMTRLARGFFDLPDEEKLRYDMSGGKKGGFIVSSHLQGEVVQDWREIVTYFTYPIKARDYSLWPDKPEAWRAATEAYSTQLMGLGCKLLGILSEAMGLEREALTKACMDMDQKVVVNYYPKCPQPNLTLGLKRHTDPGLITLLFQDDVGGLQATRDGGKTWIAVQPIKGAFVVNLGDYGHYLSNGRFKSADHRAVVNSNTSRYSIATFQNPSPEAIAYPLKIGDGEKPIIDEPITFAEMYKRKMSKDIELAKLKKLAKEQKLQEVKREKVEEENDDDKSIASAFANKRKTPSSSSNACAKSQTRVKKELNKVKKEEPVEDLEEPSSKKTTNKVQKKKVKEEANVKTTKKGGKENETKEVNKRERKVYDLPGQKRDTPEERDPLRIFYETLYQQVPTSEMAAIWMMESGLLPKDEARKVFERKQKKSQQQKLSSPMKTVVNVKKNGESVTIQKKSSTTPVSWSQKKKTPETKTEQTKKRKIKSEDDDDFVADAVKAKKQKAS